MHKSKLLRPKSLR